MPQRVDAADRHRIERDPAAVRARATDLLWNVVLALVALTLLCTVLVPPAG